MEGEGRQFKLGGATYEVSAMASTMIFKDARSSSICDPSRKSVLPIDIAKEL